MDDLEEKFTRCPQCRSFSIASTPSRIRSPLFARFFKSYNHYHCRNCGLDFKQLTSQDLSSFASNLSTRQWGKSVRVASIVALFIIISLIGLLFLFPEKHPSQSETPHVPAQPAASEIIKQELKAPPTTPPLLPEQSPPVAIESVTDSSITPAPPQPDKPLDSPSPSEITIEGVIDLAGKTRFGVNWVTQERSLLITRLSEGPLFNAGMQVGDQITHVNDTIIDRDKVLIAFRDKLNQGLAKEGLIRVNRSGKTIFFKIISSRPDQKKTEAQENSTLLFPQAPLKIRNSAPEQESSNHRWVFNSKTITITRKSKERFYISGRSDILAPWAVDNILIISKNAIPGLTNPTKIDMTFIPDEHHREPLDISDYFPAEVPVKVTFSLVDLGIKWGNSNMYLLVQ